VGAPSSSWICFSLLRSLGVCRTVMCGPRSSSCNLIYFVAEFAMHMSTDAHFALPGVKDAPNKFLNERGPGVFAIRGTDHWLELMPTTGVLHGYTLSSTRVTCTEVDMWWVSPESDEFTPQIILKLATAFGTFRGLDDVQPRLSS